MANLSGIRAGGAHIELSLRDKEFYDNLRKVEGRLGSFQRRLGIASRTPIQSENFLTLAHRVELAGVRLKVLGDRLKSVSASIRLMGSLLLGAGFGGLAAAAVGVKEFVSFDDTMLRVAAASGATNQELQEMSQLVRDIAKNSAFSPQEIALGQEQLAKGGFGVDQIKGATEGTVTLARALGVELPDAAAFALQSLNAFFDGSADEMQRVSDVTVASVNGSAQSMEDFSEAMKHVAAIAKSTNQSFEEVSAGLATLADNGIKGSIAGTGLRRMLFNMSSPVIQKRLEKSLGAFGRSAPSFLDAEGNMRPLSESLKDLGNSLDGLGTGEKLGVLQRVFGRGTNAAIKLMTELGKFQGFIGFLSTDTQGLAQAAETVIESGPGGAVRRLRSAFQELKLAVGEAFGGILYGGSKILQDLINRVSSFVSANKQLSIQLALGAIAATLAGGALIALSVAVNVVGSAMTALGGILATTAGILGILAPSTLPGVAAFAALGAAAFVMRGQIAAAFSNVLAVVKQFGGRFFAALDAISDAVASGNLALAINILANFAIVEFNRMFVALEEMFGGFISFSIEAFEAIRDNIVNLWRSTVDFVQNAWASFTGFFVDSWESATAGGVEATETMRSNWQQAISGMFDDWAGFTGSLSKLWETLTASLSQGILTFAKFTVEQLRKLEQFMNGDDSDGTLFGVDLEQKAEEFAAARDIIANDLKTKLDDIDTDTEVRRQRYGAALAAREEAARQRQKEAEKRLEELTVKAAELRRQKEEEKAKALELLKKVPDFEKFKFSLDEDGLGVDGDKGLKSVGAFNAVAAIRLGQSIASSVERQMLNIGRDQLDVLEDIRDELAGGGIV